MIKELLAKYKNGNYIVKLYSDGTKIRFSLENELIADFPDNMDVKITEKCSQNCPFCYENCTLEGQHAELFNQDGSPKYNWMNHLHGGTEMALNGNDLDHPELTEFLHFLKNKGVISNITVNQNQFMNNRRFIEFLLNEKLIYGLGISLVNPCEEFLDLLTDPLFKNTVIHTILGITTIPTYQALENKNLNVLVLGYKTKGRGVKFKDFIFDKITDFVGYIKSVHGSDKFKALTFDNLACDQLNLKENLFKDNNKEWDMLYQGDDGSHTFYLDLVHGEFAKDSTQPSENMKEIGNLTCEKMMKIVKNN